VGQGVRLLILASAVLLALAATGTTETRTTHDRDFWVALRSSGFKLPPGEPALPLALEAAALLGGGAAQPRRARPPAHGFELASERDLRGSCRAKAGDTPPPTAPTS
jgi:hypothetical protein